MKTYPLFKVHVSVDEALANIRTVLESGFINEGVQVTQFTHELQKWFNTKNIALTNSCTSAITLALKLAGVGPGDEVISTPMTCIASNTPIVTCGAKLVWADIDPDSGMIDPSNVVRLITKKTKAIVAVAWAGTPPDLDALNSIKNATNIRLILDAAHAFGATYYYKPINHFADHTCYSFQAIKHVTTGDGGALICKSSNDYERSKRLKWFGIDREHTKDAAGNWKGQQWDVGVEEAGYKFNMNNIAAAIGLSQIKHIRYILDAHMLNARAYDNLFGQSEHIKPTVVPSGAESSHWVYTIKLVPNKCKVTRDQLLERLNNEGIMAGVVHVPNDTYEAFAPYKRDLPGVREFSTCQLSLPCGWWLSLCDIGHIADRVIALSSRR